MPLVLPDLKSIKKLQRQTRSKRGRAVKPPPKSEQELKRRLNEMWQKILLPATERIKTLIKDGASAAVLAEEIESMLRAANASYAQMAPHIAETWKASLDRETRRATQASLKAALGVDVSYILDAPVLVGEVGNALRSFPSEEAARAAGAKNVREQTTEDALAVGAAQAASLIKTIPQEHFGRVAKAVADNFAGRQDAPLLEKIQDIGGVTRRRAAVIARDQTQKMTGDVNRIRQQSIGIEMYVWRTAKDQRVVGNPAGKYPEGNDKHHDHWMMEGATCRWDDPTVWSHDGGKTWEKRPADAPKTHPGVEIMDRCYASPIIDPARIAEMAKEG